MAAKPRQKRRLSLAKLRRSLGLPPLAVEFAIDNLPHLPSMVGTTLYAQAAAIDFGQLGLPLSMSNGRSNTFPATPATPATVTRVYGYRLSAGSMVLGRLGALEVLEQAQVDQRLPHRQRAAERAQAAQPVGADLEVPDRTQDAA